MPNVQFDNAQLKSTTPGEIDPAKISISGGLHYQNNFQLDGFNMNNDLDPAATGSSWNGAPNGRSQGLAIDTSLLESITVQDSNISASYGGFTGGVVEANTRKPTKKFGGGISYQITQGSANPRNISMTNYHIYGNDAAWQDFINSSSNSESTRNTPNFLKQIVRAYIESKVNDKFGILGAFAFSHSLIPLRRSDNDYKNPRYPIPSGILEANVPTDTKNQSAYLFNYFFKTYYDPSENVRIEASYTYAPEYNSRFILGGPPNQSYKWESGGHQAGLKISYENPLGLLTNTLSYSYLNNSTILQGYKDTKYWQISKCESISSECEEADSKNWAQWTTKAREGGHAPGYNSQHTLNYKIAQEFTPFSITRHWQHIFHIGAEINYSYAKFGYTNDYMRLSSATQMSEEQKKQCLSTNKQYCSPARAYGTSGSGNNIQSVSWDNGQYFSNAVFYKKGEKHIDSIAGTIFIEDDMAIYLWKLGTLHTRIGARIDIDSYMQKLNAAPRFSFNYEAPWNKGKKGHKFASQITFGANRYYGRNIFAYALSDGKNAFATTIYRGRADTVWQDVMNENANFLDKDNVSAKGGRICDVGRSERVNGEWKYWHIDHKTGREVEGRDTDC